MAYNTRGSRPLVVDGLSFRWHPGRPGEDGARVWHVLDAGVLTLPLPRGLEASPGLIASLVKRALEEGWNLADHRTLHPTPEEIRRVHEVDSSARVIAQPGIEELLEQEARELGVPDVATVSGEVVLQAVWMPAFDPVCVLTLVAAGAIGEARFIGVVDGEPVHHTASAEPDWIRDAVVSVRVASGVSVRRVQRDGMPTRVAVRDGTGPWSASEHHPEEGTPARAASVGAWRVGMDAFADHPPVRSILEGLHAYLLPPELPMARDEAARMLRLYGRWGTRDAERLFAELERCRGPWLLDLTGVAVLAGPLQGRLRRARRTRRHPLLVVVDPERPFAVGPFSTSREHAEASRRRLGVQALDNLVDGWIDSQWHAMARRELLGDDAHRRDEAVRRMERWLSSAWRPVAAPSRVEGFVFGDGEVRWEEGLPRPGLVVGTRQAWLRTVDGRCFEADRP